MTSFKRIVVLTGAGISAESGLGTFRDKDGLWTKFDLNDVATPQGFLRNPRLVHEFYNARRRNLLSAEPNPAHLALARLEAAYAGEVCVVTQNVDDLHARAGSKTVIPMHGELLKGRCGSCADVVEWTTDMVSETACAACAAIGTMRPHVVWFGEMPLFMDEITARLARCDLFISIGTSGSVFPASGFVVDALNAGAHTVELNLEPSEADTLFAEKVYGPASRVVPAFVDALLSR